jgi:hypothetical protein
MIDVNTECVGPFSEAADWLPRCRRGKEGRGTKVALSTFWRWATIGLKGIRLETIYIGSVRCTSKEALKRFFERVSEAKAGGASQDDPQPSGRTRTDAQRRNESEAAGQQLAKMIAKPPKRGRKVGTAATR